MWDISHWESGAPSIQGLQFLVRHGCGQVLGIYLGNDLVLHCLGKVNGLILLCFSLLFFFKKERTGERNID